MADNSTKRRALSALCLSTSTALINCHCCGLIQRLPATMPSTHVPRCCRCQTPLLDRQTVGNHWSEALALAALLLYPAAMLLPMLHIERLGHSHADSLLSGLVALFAEGYWLVGGVVLLFSVILPPLKLLTLWLLSAASTRWRAHHRAFAYRWIERLGRWSMLDVMLVAILVAFVKVGDLVNIQAGYGLLAFTLMVLLSLVAGLLFNPHELWRQE